MSVCYEPSTEQEHKMPQDLSLASNPLNLMITLASDHNVDQDLMRVFISREGFSRLRESLPTLADLAPIYNKVVYIGYANPMKTTLMYETLLAGFRFLFNVGNQIKISHYQASRIGHYFKACKVYELSRGKVYENYLENVMHVFAEAAADPQCSVFVESCRGTPLPWITRRKTYSRAVYNPSEDEDEFGYDTVE